jgi:hypothetical protein
MITLRGWPGPDNRSSANPVDLYAQSDLIGAPEPMKIEAVLGAQIGSARVLAARRCHLA